ncbi:MAG: hypothetical protein EP330_22245 [Deltaproteobacteria bacterium]|nr:MAG: hypothetical protein EP330_22245 [Deltaproteobacteria bacterium]
MRHALAFLLLLLGSPALASDILVLGSLVHEARLAPGQQASGTFEVRNDGEEQASVLLYQRDYVFQADGSNQFPEPGAHPRSNASHVRFEPEQLTIPAGGTAEVRWTLATPAGESRTGSLWSVLMVEPMAEQFQPESAGNERNLAITTVYRTGVQLVTHLGNARDPKLEFTAGSLDQEAGAALLSVDVSNTGDAGLAPQVYAELYDAEGNRVGRYTAGERRIYPGCSARFHIDLAAVPSGTYVAWVIADDGQDHVFGSQLPLAL